MENKIVDFKQDFIISDKSKINYLEFEGKGAEVHFMHANGFCAGTYNPFMQGLTNDFKLIASDIRGHGDSDKLDKPVKDWGIFINDLKAVIEKKMSPPVIGIGHSLGAVVTYMACAIYPHLFSSIILIDPVLLPKKLLWKIALMRNTGFGGLFPLSKGARRRKRIFKNKEEALKRFESGRGMFKSWKKEFISAYLECAMLEKEDQTLILKCDPELEASIYETVPLNEWKYGKKIKCPVLAIRGEHSDTFLYESSKHLVSIIPHCKIVTVKDTGHFIPMQQPEKCTDIIKNFIFENTQASPKNI